MKKMIGNLAKILLAAYFTALAGCSLSPDVSPQAGQLSPNSPVAGVRNFSALFANMVSVSAIQGQVPTSVSNLYKSFSSAFSVDGGAVMNGPMLMRMNQLAFSVAVAATSLKKFNLPAGMDPTVTSNTSAILASDANKVLLIQALSMQIWGRPATTDEQGVLASELTSFLVDAAKTAPSNALLKGAVNALATTLLAAPQSYSNLVTAPAS